MILSHDRQLFIVMQYLSNPLGFMTILRYCLEAIYRHHVKETIHKLAPVFLIFKYCVIILEYSTSKNV